MKGQIEKVLELASMENGRYSLELKATDIHSLLDDIAEQFAHKVSQKHGALVREFRAPWPHLKIDSAHFRNAIQNLLENALKYNDKEPRITLATRQEENRFLVSVSDNGVGIPSEHQKRIFDKFYRVSTGDLHRVKGFGIGLSYARQIIEAHGGMISVSSKPGTGSCFKIQLPLAG